MLACAEPHNSYPVVTWLPWWRESSEQTTRDARVRDSAEIGRYLEGKINSDHGRWTTMNVMMIRWVEREVRQVSAEESDGTRKIGN